MTNNQDILHGWKDFANALGRSQSTIKSYHRNKKPIPFKKLGDSQQAKIYISKKELLEWFLSLDS